MRGYAAFSFPAGLLVMSACAGAVTRWQPSLASQVPDSTPVRFAERSREPRVTGLALDWERGRLRVITERRDTVVVPEGSVLEVRLRERASHATAGAIIGWALGVAISYAACPPPKKYCREEDPTPLLATGLGALIGARVKTDWWIRVGWDPSSPHE
jgi:hypothetical protein